MVTIQEQEGLRHELTGLLNRYSAENGSGTPDFLLAEFLLGCFRQFNETLQARAAWYGGSSAEHLLPERNEMTEPEQTTTEPSDEQAGAAAEDASTAAEAQAEGDTASEGDPA